MSVRCAAAQSRRAFRGDRWLKNSVATAAALMAMLATARAAPLPPFTPVTICGVIVEQSWTPARHEPGRTGFSGSLGRDRTFPARLRVVLQNYTGIDATVARRINGLLSATELSDIDRVVVLLPSDNPDLLRGVYRLCVEGFTVRGDEGGTWTAYLRLVPAKN